MAKTIQKVFTEYLCEICDQELKTLEGNDYIEKDGKTYCHKCAVLNGIITPKEYARCSIGFLLDEDYESAKFTMEDGQIIMRRKKKNGVWYKAMELEVKQIYGNLHED